MKRLLAAAIGMTFLAFWVWAFQANSSLLDAWWTGTISTFDAYLLGLVLTGLGLVGGIGGALGLTYWWWSSERKNALWAYGFAIAGVLIAYNTHDPRLPIRESLMLYAFLYGSLGIAFSTLLYALDPEELPLRRKLGR